MKLTPELIYGFSGTLLSKGFDEVAPTPEAHLEWWELCCSRHKRVAIAAPRGHAKSTAITKSYTLASVLFRDRDYVIIVSDTYKQAVMFLQEIKRELTSNDDLISLFGVKELLTDREDDIIVELTDGYKFRITAFGSEQKIRGILWDGKRPNLIVGDDMENDELVMNPDRREKFRNWFSNALMPCLSERGIVRIVGTILHMDSMLERHMPKDRDNNTEHFDLRSIMRLPKDGWMSVRYRAHSENFEKILWPVKWTKERLMEIRQNQYVSQGNPEGYSQEYLNRPIDAKSAYFRKEDFRDFLEGDYKMPWIHYPTYCSVDLAVSTKERRDWSVFGIGSTDETGMLYVRFVLRDRLDSKEIVDQIMRLHDRFKFTTLLIGKGQIEKSIGPFLREMMSKKGKYFHIEAIPETVDKRQRSQSIRARMRAEGCKFDRNGNWYPEFEQELLEFDRGTHDDQVDMMSLFGMYLDKLMDAPTAKEIDDEEWEKENQTSLDAEWGMGRYKSTGY